MELVGACVVDKCVVELLEEVLDLILDPLLEERVEAVVDELVETLLEESGEVIVDVVVEDDAIGNLVIEVVGVVPDALRDVVEVVVETPVGVELK
jgi:hypothetical protein